MRLPDAIRNAVVYLYRGERLLGTAFLLAAPGPGDGFVYLVTAGHLVMKQTNLRLRVNLVGGGIEWVPLKDDSWWEPYDIHADVAVTLWPIPLDRSDGFRIAVIPWDHLVDDAFLVEHDIGPGDEVAFVGLFQGAPGEDSNLPIVRFGHIARMADELHAQEWPGGLKKSIEAILVEARSWGGHSGSPAFLLMSVTRHPGVIDLPQWPLGPRAVYALLGLVSGHWDLSAAVVQKNKAADDRKPEEEVKINAGIALVASAQQIAELITREDVAMDLAKRRASKKQGKAATADTMESDSPSREMTKQDFEAALRKVSRRVKPSRPVEGTSGTSG